MTRTKGASCQTWSCGKKTYSLSFFPASKEEEEYIRRQWRRGYKCCSLQATTSHKVMFRAGYVFRDGSTPEYGESGLHFYLDRKQMTVSNKLTHRYPLWFEIYYNPEEVVHTAFGSVCREIYVVPEEHSLFLELYRAPWHTFVRGIPLYSTDDSIYHDYEIVLEQVLSHAATLKSDRPEVLEEYLQWAQDVIMSCVKDYKPGMTYPPVLQMARHICKTHPIWYIQEKDEHIYSISWAVFCLAHTPELTITEMLDRFYPVWERVQQKGEVE